MTKQHPIRTALLSVSNKEGLEEFAQKLVEAVPDIVLLASGGTASVLQKAGCKVIDISDHTEAPECFGGRVKTLHPKIAGGILFRRGLDDAEAKQLGIEAIDLVVCNLYNFAAAAEQNAPLETLTEQIDIGGLTLIRSAAKNFKDVAVVVEPGDYPLLIEELASSQGALSLETRQRLAAKAFNASADYEALVSTVMTESLTGEVLLRPKLTRGMKLRYGENPDQEGWVYRLEGENGIAQAEILSGKALSYNNFEDATAAYRAAQDLKGLGQESGVAIIKHGNLCGYATGPSLTETFDLAWKGDSKSAFGSVIALTNPATLELKEQLKGRFIEVLIAPEVCGELLEWLKESKPNLRVLRVRYDVPEKVQYKSVSGGILRQTSKALHPPEQNLVTKTKPSKEQEDLIPFAVAAVKHSKSNAIALVRGAGNGSYQLVGAGAGQPNRIDSLQRLAIPKAIENLREESQNQNNPDLSRCVLASDGFFPFADSIRYASSQGITCCVQPGGSIRDDEVIEAADENQVSMIFTGERYFTH